jgi:tryptophanyl-tRNA synthetase
MSEEIWVQENNVRRKLEGEELQAFLADRAAIQAQQQAEEEAKAARQIVRESALAKLAALGLTEEELATLAV